MADMKMKPKAKTPPTPKAPGAKPASAPADPAQTAQPQDTSSIQPREDRILVRKLDASQAPPGVIAELTKQADTESPKGTKSAPVMPSSKYILATVEQAGPGGKNDDGTVIPTEVQPGDIVLVRNYAFDDAKSNFALVSESDIMATVGGQQQQATPPPQSQPQQPQPPMPQVQ